MPKSNESTDRTCHMKLLNNHLYFHFILITSELHNFVTIFIRSKSPLMKQQHIQVLKKYNTEIQIIILE
jgi:hypothetical protein